MALKVGTKVKYWIEKLPLVPANARDAQLLSVGEPEGKGARLSVVNIRTGRTYLVSADLSSKPTPGAFTVDEAELEKTDEPAPASVA